METRSLTISTTFNYDTFVTAAAVVVADEMLGNNGD